MEFRTMRYSVGAGGKNSPDDVRWVQRKLNRAIDARKIHHKKLSVDGLCGPRTMAAIRQFQLVFVAQLPNGKIDPGSLSSTTLSRLTGQRRHMPIETGWKVEEGEK